MKCRARNILNLALLVLLMAVLAACSTPQGRKRSFIGSQGDSPPQEQPAGLNPLGTIDTCAIDIHWSSNTGERVLVSRPDLFTQDASLMISALRNALRENIGTFSPPRFLISPAPIGSEAEAIAEGFRCAALIVLWEPANQRALKMTLPNPDQVPLRNMVRKQLCEFGDLNEQVRVLYYTIAGLVSLRENEYEQALHQMTLARHQDTRCFSFDGEANRENTREPN